MSGGRVGTGGPPILGALRESARWVDEGLGAFFDSLAGATWTVLPDDARYSIMAGGKRVRPFLVRSACEALGSRPSSALPAAMAVELVHGYSLIHDDLPCMDDDDLRRGIPTLHVAQDVPRAVLAADWLLLSAFEVLISSPFSPSRTSEMVARLARAAGAPFLVSGQYRDLNPPTDPTVEWVETVQRGKTAAMIRVSMELGAIAAGMPEDSLEKVSAVGESLGVLFQVTDDMLDVTSSREEMGKATGKDISRGKATHPAILGLDAARLEAAGLASRIREGCASLRGDWSRVADLADYLLVRKS